MYETFNKHYIQIDDKNNIILGWSDGIHPEKDITDAICINDKGGYQFRLLLDGEENPPLQHDSGVYLYRYIDNIVVAKTQNQIQAEIDDLPQPEPIPDYNAFVRGMMEAMQNE